MTPQEQELSRTMAQVNQDLQNFGSVLPSTRQALLNAQTGIRNFGTITDTAAGALGKLSDAVGTYTREVYRGNTSASAANNALDNLNEAAKIAAVGLSMMIPGSTLMKAVYAGLTYFATKLFDVGTDAAKAANELADKQYAMYQGIAKAGGAAEDGMRGVFDSAQQMGVLLDEFGDYTELIRHSGEDLAAFGGTVGAGRKALGNIGIEVNRSREAFFRLGMTQQDINDATATYVSLQSRLGLATQKDIANTEKMSAGARAYIEEQDKLTKITGVDRKTREAARISALNEERFRAKLRGMELAGNRDAVKNMTLFNDVVSGLAPEVAKGARDMFAGNLSSEEAQKLQRSAPEAFATLQRLLDNSIQPAEAAQTILSQVQQTGDQLGTTLGLTGNFNTKFISMSESADLAAKLQTGMAEKFRMADEAYAKQIRAPERTTKDIAEISAGLRETGLTLNRQMADALPVLMTPARKLAEAASSAAEALDKFTRALKKQEDEVKPVNRRVQEGRLERPTQPGTQPATPPGAQPPTTAASPPAATTQPPTGTAQPPSRERRGKLEQAQPPAVAPPAPTNVPAKPAVQPPTTGGAAQTQDAIARRQRDLEAIRGMIRRAETVSDSYDLFGGQRRATMELSKMTVDQVLAAQEQRIKAGLKKGESSAAGAYQILRDTLKKKVAQLEIRGDQRFDKDLQDRLADALISDAGYESYAQNPSPEAKAAFVKRLSKIWAGLPKGPSGVSEFQGQNKNQATIGWQDALSSFGDGGIAWVNQLARIGEKGPEAIIPLKNGSVPVTISAGGLMDNMAVPDIDPEKLESMSKGMTQNIGQEFKVAMSDLVQQLQQKTQPNDTLGQQNLSALLDMNKLLKTLVNSNQKIAQAALN